MPAKVEIYTTRVCPFCVRAKQLFEEIEIGFVEHLVDGDQEKMMEMLKRSGGRRTVPQIFIDQQHIGGCDDLYHMHSHDKLNRLLGR